MAGREERLTPATRNYVIFGLLLIVALALAAREFFGPDSGRGEPDSALRLLVVGGQAATVEALDEVDGFSVMHLGVAEAIELGRELVDDDPPAWAAVAAYADQSGYGFVALDLRGPEGGPPPSWELDAGEDDLGPLPPPNAHFAVLSAGDLAHEGPRMRWVELAPFAYEAPLAELDSIRLALYEHPDLLALWQPSATVTEVQAREVLRNRGLESRRESIAADQQRWRELARLWPEPGELTGNLAGEWEQVQAAPIRGGVLVEVRRVTPTVSVFRRPWLEVHDDAHLWFVPRGPLEAGEADLAGARVPCPDLPARLEGEISVAPDGSALVLRESPMSAAKLYAFDEQAAREGRCHAELRATLPLGERAVGRPNAAGRMAWNYDDDWLHWFDEGTSHQARVPGIHAFSGPWWVDDELLAVIAERPLGPPDYGVDRVLSLLDVRRPADPESGEDEPLRAALDAAALFGEGAQGLSLLDLRPAGESELLLLTESCEADEPDDTRPCLHRLHGEQPLAELLPALAAGELDERPYTLETLGPIGPYLALAIAAEGGRALWLAAEGAGQPRLMYADLRGPQALEPRRVDEDLRPDAAPRISADGRLAIIEVTLTLDELGSVSIARAFVLPAPAPGEGEAGEPVAGEPVAGEPVADEPVAGEPAPAPSEVH
jgi:hypothetical protein